MRAKKPNLEQRESFRCRVLDSRQGCELTIGSNLLPGTLLDESAGGFSVLVDRPPGLSAEQTAELRTESGWFAVRVVHVAPVVPSEGNGAAAAEAQDQWFRLGLSRLGETRLADPLRVWWSAGSLYFRLSRWCSSSGILVVCGVFLAVAVVAAAMALMGVHWPMVVRDIRRILPRDDQPTEVDAPTWPQPSPLSEEPWRPASGDAPFSAGAANVRSDGWGGDFGGLVFNAPSGHGGSPEIPVFRSELDLRNAIRRLPGPLALTIPAVVSKLQLTHSQQERIRQLTEATSQAIRSLDAKLSGRQREEISRQRARLLDEARREALKVLTEQQRGQWEELFGEQ